METKYIAIDNEKFKDDFYRSDKSLLCKNYFGEKVNDDTALKLKIFERLNRVGDR